MHKFQILLAFVFITLLISCSENEKTKPMFLASSYPIYSILTEIAGEAAEVDYIVPTGASPHTYLPKPSDIKKASSAIALFYVAQNLDGWISGVPAKNKIKMIDMVPMDNLIYFSCGHDHSTDDGHIHDHEHEIDPHFWLDPLTVKAMLKDITNQMVRLYPEGESQFRANAEKFATELEKLDIELQELLLPVRGKDLFLHHPSFNYFADRYGLFYVGSIEETPGKEPSPKFIAELVENIKESQVKAIFSEPQLNGKTAQVIANEAGVKIFELSPEGEPKTSKKYSEILLNNSQIIRKALE